MDFSSVPKTLAEVGPKDLSNPIFPKTKGRPVFELRAERKAF